MSAVTEPDNEAGDQEPKREWIGAARFLRGLYRHVAAVLAAVGMASIAHQLGVDWRGVLEQVLSFWDHTVRPVMTWVLNWSVTAPLRSLFSVRLEMNPWVVDYLSIGLVLCFSAVRDHNVRRKSKSRGFLSELSPPVYFVLMILPGHTY